MKSNDQPAGGVSTADHPGPAAGPDQPSRLLSPPETDSPAADEWPAWFGRSRREAWQLFERTAAPARTEQAWRFANVGRLALDGYHLPRPLSAEAAARLVDRSVGNAEVAGTMIFGNDQLLSRRVAAAEPLARQGVVWLPLEEAMRRHPELLQRHFLAQEATLGSKKFAALHRAHVRTGTFLHVPRGVRVELPLEVFHWLSGDAGSTFPHTLVVAEEGSEVTLIDYLHSEHERETGFACALNDLIVGPGAKVTYLCAQNWGEQVVSIQLNTTRVDRDASALSLYLNLGAAYARLENLSQLTGTGGRSDMLAATVADGAQEFDQRTLQDHQAPHTTSDLLYKNALTDATRAIFAGLIRVEPAAQHTDAYQKVRNLLLSKEAEANSMPGLEIMADEVRCTHGATSGSVEREELFYLLSRGIDALTAKQLIVHGFLNEILDRLPDARLTERFRGLLDEKFARLRARAGGGSAANLLAVTPDVTGEGADDAVLQVDNQGQELLTTDGVAAA